MDLLNFLKETDGFENALDFAIEHGLLPGKSPQTCIKCGTEGGLRWCKNSRVINIPYMYVCVIRQCRTTVSLGRNTVFDHLSFPLPQALRMIYFWLLKISVKDTADQLVLSEFLVGEWFQYFREACAFIIMNYTEAIGGPGCTVEISEYHLQSQDESNEIWVFTGIDRKTGHNFAIHVDSLDNEILWPVVKNYILPGTEVVTERFKEFNKIEKGEENPSLRFVHPNKSVRLDNHYHLDNMWAALKQYVHSETPPKHFSCQELYVYQFLYFNRDAFLNKPASELILPFLSDLRLVYPGFEKAKHLDYKRQRLSNRVHN